MTPAQERLIVALQDGIAGQELLVRLRPLEPLPRLSERQGEILNALGDGLTNREIALRVCLSSQTVKNYLNMLYRKFDVASRHGLVARAFRLGLLS